MAVASQVSLRSIQQLSQVAHGSSDAFALKKKDPVGCSMSLKTEFLPQNPMKIENFNSSPSSQFRLELKKEPVTCFLDSVDSDSSSSGNQLLFAHQTPSVGTLMAPMMNFKSLSSTPGVTIEKTKMDFSVKRPKLAPKMDLGGGGRGNNNKNANGGGDGGDDGGDDDDYLGGEDDGEGDDDNGILRKMTIIELFDRETVEAVLQEWFRSITELPSGLRRAVELGLMSSAQLVRFLSIDARPTLARAISRLAPSDVSRGFIGRMIADPGFAFKFGLEQAITIGTAAHWEIKQRGDRLKDEWDLALVNVLAQAACNAAIVWSVSPSRSYGSTSRHDWQNMIQKLPNNVFDKSYPLREFTLPGRVASFVYQAAHLSLVGTMVGAAAGSLSNALVDVRKQWNPEFRPSVTVPSTSTSAIAYGAFLGISGNLRYQAVYGVDRFLQQNMNSLSLAVMASSGLRYFNRYLGEPSRLMWLGMDREAQASTKAQAFRRQSSQAGSSVWRLLPFDLPNIEFLNGPATGERKSAPRRPRRKVKRKVSLAQ